MPSSRVIEVAPQRLATWLTGFAARHGEASCTVDGDVIEYVALDGARARVAPPFAKDFAPHVAADSADADPAAGILGHALRPRVVGMLLVRLGGYAAGVFEGDQLAASKVGSRLVHGRSAAGGWSQQRFARRREGQAREALDAAVSAAALVLLPLRERLDIVVTGGDRAALRTVLADARLASVAPLLDTRVLDVPDPKAAVLRASIQAARAVRITLTGPD